MSQQVQDRSSLHGVHWSRVFRRSTVWPDTWVLCDSRSIWSKSHPHWEVIDELCNEIDVPGRNEGRRRSPGGTVSTCKKDWALLDGGIFMRAGNYCTGRRGVWVVGSMVLRFLCSRLGIVPPRRLQGEKRLPTQTELEWCLRMQRHRGREALEEQLIQLGQCFND
jgi:hypothetical protein